MGSVSKAFIAVCITILGTAAQAFAQSAVIPPLNSAPCTPLFVCKVLPPRKTTSVRVDTSLNHQREWCRRYATSWTNDADSVAMVVVDGLRGITVDQEEIEVSAARDLMKCSSDWAPRSTSGEPIAPLVPSSGPSVRPIVRLAPSTQYFDELGYFNPESAAFEDLLFVIPSEWGNGSCEDESCGETPLRVCLYPQECWQ